MRKIESTARVYLVGTKLLVKQCEEFEEKVKKWGNFQKYISRKLLGRFLSSLVYRVAYMEGIKYDNLIEIGPVIIMEIATRG